MIKQLTFEDQQELKNCIISAMQDKKARNIVSIELKGLNNSFTDYFIICHGTSKPHVEAISNFIEESTIKKLHQKPWQKEGFENKEWILLDYFDIVVHVFLEEKRDFYSIEELWGDGKIENHDEIYDSLKTTVPKIKRNDRRTKR